MWQIQNVSFNCCSNCIWDWSVTCWNSLIQLISKRSSHFYLLFTLSIPYRLPGKVLGACKWHSGRWGSPAVKAAMFITVSDVWASQLADGGAASSLWCLRVAYWRQLECLHLQPDVLGFQAFHSTSMCDKVDSALPWAHACADLLQLCKGLVLSSRSGCFYRGVDVFVCVPVWQQCVGLGFLLDCSQNLRGRVCPRCHIPNLSGVRAELNLICFVFCRVFSY